LFKRKSQPWTTQNGGSRWFFRGIIYVNIVKNLRKI